MWKKISTILYVPVPKNYSPNKNRPKTLIWFILNFRIHCHSQIPRISYLRPTQFHVPIHDVILCYYKIYFIKENWNSTPMLILEHEKGMVKRHLDSMNVMTINTNERFLPFFIYFFYFRFKILFNRNLKYIFINNFVIFFKDKVYLQN